MPGFGHLPEIILLLLIALLVFGPKRMIEMGSSFGKAFREFRESVKDIPGMGGVANLGGLLHDDEPRSTPFTVANSYTPTATVERDETAAQAVPTAAVNGTTQAATTPTTPGQDGTIVEGTVERVQRIDEPADE